MSTKRIVLVLLHFLKGLHGLYGLRQQPRYAAPAQNVIKDEHFRDNPPNPEYRPGVDDPFYSLSRIYSGDRPEIREIIARMRAAVDDYPGDRVLIGEIYNTVDRLMPYYGEGGRGCSGFRGNRGIYLP
jgi:hypothetical protein